MFSKPAIVLGVLSAALLATSGQTQAFSNYPSYSDDLAATARPNRGYGVQEGSLARLTLVDRQSGQSLPIVWHRGRAYVAGQPGRRYALALQNTAQERVLAVTAVDGVNVVTGQTADDVGIGSQSGYVFSPGQRYEVAGWRKSDTQIAAFEFTALSNSYAARTGRPEQVGVIRVALFREQPPVQVSSDELAAPQRDKAARGSAAAAAPSSQSADKKQSAPEASRRAFESESQGTGHGRREYSSVEHTRFVRAQTTPNEVLSIYYDSRENLIAQGILPAQRIEHRYGQALPRCRQPSNPSGYAADPPAANCY